MPVVVLSSKASGRISSGRTRAYSTSGSRSICRGILISGGRGYERNGKRHKDSKNFFKIDIFRESFDNDDITRTV